MPPTIVHRDYYAMLEILPSADSATIKSAYRRLALAKHPDRQKNVPNATADFQLVILTATCYQSIPVWSVNYDWCSYIKINEAYGELVDDDKRLEYENIYRSIIGPREIKNGKIAGLEKTASAA